MARGFQCRTKYLESNRSSTLSCQQWIAESPAKAFDYANAIVSEGALPVSNGVPLANVIITQSPYDVSGFVVQISGAARLAQGGGIKLDYSGASSTSEAQPAVS